MKGNAMKTPTTDRWKYRRNQCKPRHQEHEVGWYALAAAVVRQAVEDWKDAVRTWERSEPKQGRMSAKWQDHYDKWHPKCERDGSCSVARLEDIELKLEDLE